MAQSANVNINIGSKVDLKGFKQAESAAAKLTKGVKKLGLAVGLAYSAKAIADYGKAAMKAAADDQKAQKILSNNLKNLGLAYASVGAENFIKNMEKQTAILDNDLRPAYSQLAQVTGSVNKTQELMTLAFDASSGSGLDFATTVNILSQAYVGNTKGLKQLNLGLTQAELKSMSFAEIQDKIAATYAGSGAVALDTYAGSMAKLSVATSNAAETIGGALLDGIIAVTGNDGIDGLIKDIDTLAKGFGFLITQVTGAIGALSGQDARKAFSTGYYTGGGRAGGSSVFKPKGMGNVALTGGSNMDTQRSSLAAAKKTEASAKKRAADLLAATKKSAAATAKAARDAALNAKNQAALTKANAAFDLKQISIANALKETYDKDTKLRLLAMQAIEEDNGEAAIKYLEQLGILQKAVQTAKLNGITTISDASLHALNVELLTELQNIDASKMKDADKEAAKLAAFAKYNDAIIKEGGLAETSYYNERTQIELTYIAKRAALDNYGAASETLRKIIESEELSLIKTVSTAQYAADLARYNSLIDYIRLLGEAKAAAATLATDIYTANLFGDLPSSGAADPNLGGDSGDTGGGAGGDYGDPSYPDTGGDYGDPSYPDLGGGAGGDYGSPSYPDAMSNTNGITVIVNTGATLGSEEVIVQAVQDAMQTLNRRGSNVSYAGAI